jgi:hypothetical protein
MEKTGILSVVILVIAAIFFSGCTSSPFPVQSPGSSTTDTEFSPLLVPAEALPQGLILVGDGPMQSPDITDMMRKYGLQKGHRALYADTLHPTDKAKVMEQDIMIFSRANASAMLDEYQKSLTRIQNNKIVSLPLPDPDLGEKSFAVKVSTVGPTGAETYHYIFGFVQSGIFEILSMDGTPETYPGILHAAESAAGNARDW